MRIIDKNLNSQRIETRDGYLIVPATLSKIGVFDYHAKELGLNDDAIKKVARTEHSLFSAQTIKSFEGVPLTIGHPETGVNAKNFKEFAVGVVRNVRKEGDALVADAWVYDEQAIKVINEQGIKELSCGYDCDVIPSQVNDAEFEMTPMIGNHVALVAKGRCGPTVKLADEEKTFMSKAAAFFETLLSPFGIKLSDEQKQVLEKVSEKANPDTKQEDNPPANSINKEKDIVQEAELEKENADLKAKLAKIEDEQKQSEVRQRTLAEVKQHFPELKLADSDTARQIQEKAILDQHIATADELKTLSDEAIGGMYLVAKKAKSTHLGHQIGKALIGDNVPAHAGLDFNKLYGDTK